MRTLMAVWLIGGSLLLYGFLTPGPLDAEGEAAMCPVESRVFEGARYKDEARSLCLLFDNGSVYEYQNVPVNVYEEFMKTRRKGAFFNERIRNVYPFRRVRAQAEEASR